MPTRENMASRVREQALTFGYDDCGIIRLDDLAGFDEKLAERVARFPESTASFANYKRSLPQIRERFPWARSAVICVRRYGKYRIPPGLEGMIGKFYLTDCRRDERTRGYQNSVSFERFLESLGLRLAFDRDYGIVPYRWAALKAGLGTIRKNNFFYTRDGSWVDIEAWLVDAELELKKAAGLQPCPAGCTLCAASCPTRSLAEPYMTNRETCVSNLTTWKGRDMPREPHRRECGRWVYGGDACQDACPFNKGKWTTEEEFPGLDELAASLSLEKIATMDYDSLRGVVAEKFWYIGKDDAWKWKVDALNAMLNEYRDAYRDAVECALGDADPRVREMAAFVMGELAVNAEG